VRPEGVTGSVGPQRHPGGHLADCKVGSAAQPWRGFEGKGPTRKAKPSEVVSPVDRCPGCTLRPTFGSTTQSRPRLRPTGDAHADSRSRADKPVPAIFPGPKAVTSKATQNELNPSNLSKRGLCTSAVPLLLVHRALTAAADYLIQHPATGSRDEPRFPITDD
jgi:hypothetical protein